MDYLRMERVEGGFILVPVEEIGIVSTYTQNMAEAGEPQDLVHHEDQALVHVKCANINVVVQHTVTWIEDKLLAMGGNKVLGR